MLAQEAREMSGFSGTNKPWMSVLWSGVSLTIFGAGLLAMGEAIGIVALLFGPILLSIGVWMRSNQIWEPKEPPAAPQQIIEKHVVEEVIKVRCKYCGTLNDVNDKACSACGGTL
jgi:hypothetical protein